MDTSCMIVVAHVLVAQRMGMEIHVRNQIMTMNIDFIHLLKLPVICAQGETVSGMTVVLAQVPAQVPGRGPGQDSERPQTAYQIPVLFGGDFFLLFHKKLGIRENIKINLEDKYGY